MTSMLCPSSIPYHILDSGRRCSCCRETGHTIQNCDDPRISTLQKECERAADNSGSEQSFKQWIMNYPDPNVAKALCLRLRLVQSVKEVNSVEKYTEVLLNEFWQIPQMNRIFDSLLQDHDWDPLEFLEPNPVSVPVPNPVPNPVPAPLVAPLAIPNPYDSNLADDYDYGQDDLFEAISQLNLAIEFEQEIVQHEHQPQELKQDIIIQMHKYPDPTEILEPCPICYDDVKENLCTYNCSHTICIECFIKTAENPKKIICALCRTTVTQVIVQKEEQYNKIIE